MQERRNSTRTCHDFIPKRRASAAHTPAISRPSRGRSSAVERAKSDAPDVRRPVPARLTPAAAAVVAGADREEHDQPEDPPRECRRGGDQARGAAAFIAVLLLSPLLFLAAALLYEDQVARLEEH